MRNLSYIFIIIFFSCNPSPGPQNSATGSEPQEIISDSTAQRLIKQKEAQAKKMSTAQITYFVIQVPDNKFGYTIFIDGQMYIEQKSIPAINGNAGFNTKEEAEKIAKLAIEKIKLGELPPTISKEELKANGVTIHP